MKAIAARSRGFIYYIAVAGTTGARNELPPDLADHIARLKAVTGKPVAVGFGISRPEQVAAVAPRGRRRHRRQRPRAEDRGTVQPPAGRIDLRHGRFSGRAGDGESSTGFIGQSICVSGTSFPRRRESGRWAWCSVTQQMIGVVTLSAAKGLTP